MGSPRTSTCNKGVSSSRRSCELCRGADCNSSCRPRVASAVVGITLELIVTVGFLQQTTVYYGTVVLTGVRGCHDSGYKHGFFLFTVTANSLPAILITLYVQSDNFRKTLCAGDQNSLNLLATPGLRAESCIYTRPPGLFVISQANNTSFSR